MSGGSKKSDGTARTNCGMIHDSKTRSKTFSGIAQAMAEQWGKIEEDENDDSDERGI